MQWYSPLEDEDYDLSVQSQPHRERLVWIGNDECLLLCDMGIVGMLCQKVRTDTTSGMTCLEIIPGEAMMKPSSGL